MASETSGQPPPAFAGPYILGKTLGRGSFSKVKLGTHHKTGEQVAIKILEKKHLDESPQNLQKVEQEIRLLQLVNHPNILRLLEVIHSRKFLFLVLEYIPGGELFQMLRKQKLSMEQAFAYFHTVIGAIEYIHNCSICHRDIKPENILLDEDGSLKVADFGMASLVSGDRLLKTSCGSPHYASPEVIHGRAYNGFKSDVWSLGVLYYGFCASCLPFNDTNIQRLLQKVCTGVYTVPPHFPPVLVDFISKLIEVDVDKRLTIAELKQHRWWVEMCQKGSLDPTNSLKAAPKSTIPKLLTRPTASGGQGSVSAGDGGEKPEAQSNVMELQPAFAGPYILGSTLGKGSRSKVKLATHHKTGKQVAVKMLNKKHLSQSPQNLQKVEQEIQLLKLIDHPNVLRLLEVIHSSKYLFLVLEYIPGGELFQLLYKQRLSLEQAFKYFHTTLGAIEHIHGHNICHRDIKPENILVDEDGSLKVADFGMSSMVPKDKLLTTSCGSPHYASPEVIQGRAYDGFKSDIWSLGVMYYGFCAGCLPFNHSNIQKLLQKVCTGVYSVPPAFPALLTDFISKMIELDPQKRYSIAELKQHDWWLEMCEKCNLDPTHGKGEPIPGLRPASPSSTTAGTAAKAASSHSDASNALEGLDELNDIEELRSRLHMVAGKIQDIHTYALHLESDVDSSEARLRTLQEQLKQMQTPDAALDIAPPGLGSVVPQDVVDMFLDWGWKEEDVHDQILSKGPSLGKAMHHLLQHHKAHAKEGSKDLMFDIVRDGSPRPVLKQNFSAVQLANPKPRSVKRQFSEGQLLKQKDKSVWSRFFGK